jgi:hypothetical protein
MSSLPSDVGSPPKPKKVTADRAVTKPIIEKLKKFKTQTDSEAYNKTLDVLILEVQSLKITDSEHKESRPLTAHQLFVQRYMLSNSDGSQTEKMKRANQAWRENPHQFDGQPLDLTWAHRDTPHVEFQIAGKISGFECPGCRETISIAESLYECFQKGSGYDCMCPYCDQRVKQYYNRNVKDNPRLQLEGPSKKTKYLKILKTKK